MSEQKNKTKIINKKSFGKDSKLKVKLHDNGLPIIFDESKVVITGIPSELFDVKELDPKTCKVEFYNYQKECIDAKIKDHIDKIETLKVKRESIDDKISEVTTGKKSKKSLLSKRERMLAELAKIDAELEE